MTPQNSQPTPNGPDEVFTGGCECPAHRGGCASEGLSGAGMTRRGVLGGTLAAAGVLGLTACGGSDDEGSDDGGSAGGDSTDGGDSGAITVPKSDVPVGDGTVLEKEKVIVAQPSEGEYVAYDAVCPHKQCLVSQIKETELVCPCHDSVFDAKTGDVTGGPAETGLAKYTVTEDGDNLSITKA